VVITTGTLYVDTWYFFTIMQSMLVFFLFPNLSIIQELACEMMFPASEPVISSFFYFGGLAIGLLIAFLLEIGLNFDPSTVDPKQKQLFILKNCLLYLILVFSGLLATSFVQ